MSGQQASLAPKELAKGLGPARTGGQRPAFEFVSVAQMLADIHPPAWLVRGYLERDTAALIFGDPGSGKSFIALDLATSVAAGTPWHNHATAQGAVFYIAGEGYNGLARRLKAWEIDRGVSLAEAPLYVSRCAASLTEPASTAAVTAAIRKLAESTGVAPILIVVDTLARNFGPADENSTQDMSAFIAALDALRAPWGACMLVVHHSGHADKSRARGAMALKGALDWEFRAAKDENGVIRLECTKSKDHEPPPPNAFRLSTVELTGVESDDGEPVTSAVLTPAAYTEPPKQGKAGRGRHQTKALELLRQMYDERVSTLWEGGYPGDTARVETKEWRDACIAEDIPYKRRHELAGSLEKVGLIKCAGIYVYLT